MYTRDELQLKISNELFDYTQIIDEPAVNERVAHALHCIAAALLENAKAIDDFNLDLPGLWHVGDALKEAAKEISTAIYALED